MWKYNLHQSLRHLPYDLSVACHVPCPDPFPKIQTNVCTFFSLSLWIISLISKVGGTGVSILHGGISHEWIVTSGCLRVCDGESVALKSLKRKRKKNESKPGIKCYQISRISKEEKESMWTTKRLRIRCHKLLLSIIQRMIPLKWDKMEGKRNRKCEKEH